MDSKTYIANAIRTESVPASLDINQVGLHALLELTVAVSEIADLVKRRLYYGKPVEHDKLMPHVHVVEAFSGYLANLSENGELNDRLSQEQVDSFQLPPEIAGIKLENINIRLLHAALGMFTESGEQLLALRKQYETGELDKVNFGEEVGDIEWYQAIAFDETGVSEAEIREKNIAKLRARFPNKFDSYAALNRDLATERTILEGDTAHLNASPANAAHLEGSIAQLRSGQVQEHKLVEG